MDFYDSLIDKGLIGVLRHKEYKTPDFVGLPKVLDYLEDIVKNGKSVFVEGDYDVDGLCCSLVIQDAFKDLGVNFEMYKYRKRTHAVDRVAIQQCLRGHFDYFLVADTGSSDLDLLTTLTQSGTKVIVLDHHNTDYEYEDFGEIAIINTELENQFGRKEDLGLSAGALCFTVMDALYQRLGKESPQRLAAYATVSLFADSMSFKYNLNQAIYYYGVEQPEEEIPACLLYFKGDYSRFNARYINYKLAPRLNACFRSESLAVLNHLFFEEQTDEFRKMYIDQIEQLYTENRQMVHVVSDVMGEVAVEMNQFVYGDLDKLASQFDIEGLKLSNYTGLIANNLSSRFGKTGIVTCSVDGGYKGSLRDQSGRNYLGLFKQICYAGGHNAAFGMKIDLFGMQQFREDLVRIDKNYVPSAIEDAPIVMDLPDGGAPDMALLRDMALFNEFSSPQVPIALLRKRLVGDIRYYKAEYYYTYRWGEVTIKSDVKVPFGSWVLIRPIYAGTLELRVQR